MARKYSIAEARHNLAALVHELEQQELIELTRRGEPVAMLVSMRAYRRLTEPRGDFWNAYERFRRSHRLSKLNIQPEVFADVRDRSTGREVDW
ncbi:MAG: type II toxin-antitoxin system Phd/YefM family antitoxin [Anaerolineales bacterium]|nr:type II toxin-antitoxin system Phd/YefM family antitoxin [Anaerolineales bacterium]